MQYPEILAPAGGMAQLEAAAAAGCDAVYLGAKAFNARMGADNFESLSEAVSYCHARGIRVYVTFNTLLQEAELPRAAETLREIAESGADGMLAADLGTVLLWKACCPSLPIHASTQMTVHSPAGAKLLSSLGFSRVVLAREMTREEIEAVVRAVPQMETEVFVHGALCMSVSGQCYLSSILGGRSGNRGQCAQPCRLDFLCQGRHYALSLKDLSLIGRAREIAGTGVTSLKIEGRLKRPEYAAAAVLELRKALRGETADLSLLEDVFSRSGFTSGYWDGKRDARMFGRRTAEDAAGEKEAAARVRSAIRVPSAHVPADMLLTVRRGQNAVLTVKARGRSVTVQGAVPEEASNRPLDREHAENALKKLGGTPFFAESIRIDLDEGLFLPGSAMNAMRQAAVNMLSAALGEISPWPFTPPDLSLKAAPPSPISRAFLSNRTQASDEVFSLFDRVYLPAGEIDDALAKRWPDKLCARCERFSFGVSEEKLLSDLNRCASLGISECAVSGLAGIELAREAALSMHGECTLGILNSLSLSMYASLGLRSSDVSLECTKGNLEAITPSIPIGMAVYGHLPLMTFRSCPARSESGCGRCGGNPVLHDRGGDFPIQCHQKRFSVMLNPKPLWLGDLKDELPHGVATSFYFTHESAEGCARVKRQFDRGEALGGDFTRALFRRKLL